MDNKIHKRDYDKDPIVIEDYNPLFLFLLMISLIPVMILIYIYNPGGTSENSLSRNIFIIIPIIMYPFINAYFKSKGKRKVILTENSIMFMHENRIIEEIDVSKITGIKKTSSSIYHKSQNLKWYQSMGLFIIFPLIVITQKAYYLLLIFPIVAIFFIVAKYVFHKLKDKRYQYRFYDAILIYSKENFINILPTTNKEYLEVKNYFLTKELGDIQNKKIYFELIGAYGFENINLQGEK